jgi:hypothetical protein
MQCEEINMVKYAKLDSSNKVIDVIVIDDAYENETLGQAFIKDECKIEGNWIKSSVSRKNNAGIGMIYDSTKDAFYNEQPYPSWVLDEQTCIWKAPVDNPFDNYWKYTWDEKTQNWVEN